MRRSYERRMTMIQIRNVPEDVHRRRQARAAMKGLSLADLTLADITDHDPTPLLRSVGTAKPPDTGGVGCSSRRFVSVHKSPVHGLRNASGRG